MTEAASDRCDDPWLLLDRSRGGSERRPRLLACASARLLGHLLPSESRDALATCERFADGLATPEELLRVRQLAGDGHRRVNQHISFKKRTVRPQARAAL